MQVWLLYMKYTQGNVFFNTWYNNSLLEGSILSILGVASIVTVNECTFSNNKALVSGAAVRMEKSSNCPMVISNSVFSDNYGHGRGSVILNIQGNLNISNSIFSNNVGGAGYQGVIAASEDYFADCMQQSPGEIMVSNGNSSVSVTGCTFAHNNPILAGGILNCPELSGGLCDGAEVIAGTPIKFVIYPVNYCQEQISSNEQDANRLRIQTVNKQVCDATTLSGNSHLHLECPTDSVIVRIYTAIYGSYITLAPCEFIPGACYISAIPIVARKCLNQQSCDLYSVDVSTLPNPCNGATVYLAVSVLCQSSLPEETSWSAVNATFVEQVQMTLVGEPHFEFTFDDSSVPIQNGILNMTILPAEAFPANTVCFGSGFYGGASLGPEGRTEEFTITLYDMYGNLVPIASTFPVVEVVYLNDSSTISASVVYNSTQLNFQAYYRIEYLNFGEYQVTVFVNSELAQQSVVIFSKYECLWVPNIYRSLLTI